MVSRFRRSSGVSVTAAMALAGLLGLGACGRSGRLGSPGSNLEHQIGRTSVPPGQPRIPCKDGYTHKNIISYVKSLVRHIAAANPKSFSGDNSVTKICVQIMEDEKFSASMDPDSGLMHVNTGLFLKKYGLDSDAAIAGVIAHELAHFTMNHGEVRPSQLDLPSDYDDAAYKAKLAEYKAIEKRAATMIGAAYAQVSKKYGDRLIEIMTPAFSEIRKLNGSERELRDNEWTVNLFQDFKTEIANYRTGGQHEKADAMMASYLFNHVRHLTSYRPKLPSAIRDAREPWATMATADEERERLVVDANEFEHSKEVLVPDLKRLRAPYAQWQEQQADEVGFEFFIRAGFEPRVYPEIFRQLGHFVAGADDCAKEVGPGTKPPRIHPDREPRGLHPDACWRYWNLRYSEPAIHDADYSRLMPSTPMLDLPQLAGQRESIVAKVGE